MNTIFIVLSQDHVISKCVLQIYMYLFKNINSFKFNFILFIYFLYKTDFDEISNSSLNSQFTPH